MLLILEGKILFTDIPVQLADEFGMHGSQIFLTSVFIYHLVVQPVDEYSHQSRVREHKCLELVKSNLCEYLNWTYIPITVIDSKVLVSSNECVSGQYNGWI